ncbi:glycoside hydrolase family 43 protein [Roseateles paludis]|uniref:Glycoside hydrolase 43 family protein n=1 Tax=Roseateles paludis TaxID=3145238 RepID=A0ABV0G373_9BURK
MRALLLAVCLVWAAFAASAGPRYTNPILHADYSDPDVIRVGDSYYLVASSFHFSPGIPVLKSTDLVHWKLIGHVLPKLDFAPAYDMLAPYPLTDGVSKPVGGTLRYMGGVWAPSIRHHQGRFYVYWATPDEGIFMSTATDPAGPWSPPTTVLAGPGYEDPCPFWDDDGKAYLVHSKVGAGPVILHAMSADGTRLLDDGLTIIEDKVKLPVLEGPKLYKRNGYYYVLAPIGGVGTGPQVALRSRRITGPYEHQVVLKPGNGLLGPHQGGYVETPSGQGWFIHFNSTGAFGRIAHLQPVVWRDDWPWMGTPEGLPVLDHAYPDTDAVSTDRLQDSDEFSSERLGLQWSWNHNPDDKRWSLSARPGFMRLEAGRARQLVGARNTLTQVLQGPQADIRARIEFGAMGEQQRAGLSLFGVRVPWIGVLREAGVTYLAYANAGVEVRGPRLDGQAVILRAEVKQDQTVQFSYSLSETAPFQPFQPLGPVTPLATFSWWKGSRPAVFTYIKSDIDEPRAPPGTIKHVITHNYVDVDWFRVSPGNSTQP